MTEEQPQGSQPRRWIDIEEDLEDAEMDAREALLFWANGTGPRPVAGRSADAGDVSLDAGVSILRTTITTGPS